MPAWPRNIVPSQVSPFKMPGSLLSLSDSGKAQLRSTLQRGRVWTEEYQLFDTQSDDGLALLMTINNYFLNGTIFTIDHRLYQTHTGGGSGTPRVAGAGQSGTSILTDGWTGTDPVLKAGNIIKFASIDQVFDLAADAPNLSAGAVTLSLNPGIVVGGEPPDNDLITYTGVQLNAFLLDVPDFPYAFGRKHLKGLTLTFMESV